MSNWIKVKLGDIVELKRESYQPKPDEVLPYIGLEHIGQGTLRLISVGKSNEVTSTKSYFSKGDILFGKLRPYFRKVVRPKFNGVCSTDILVLTSKNPRKFNQTFLFYLMASQEMIDLATASSSGTKMPRADWKVLQNLEISIPEDVNEQERIGKILETIDDKIDINIRMNKTLEEMAMTLYKHWFVDFGPFQDGEFVESELGMIPEGWEIKKLSDIVEIRTTSINPSKTPGEFYYHYSIPAYDERKLPSLNSAESIKSNKYLIETDTVLVSKLNPATPRIWTVYFKKESKNKQITSTEFIHYVPKQNINFAWLNCYLRSDDFQNEFKSNATGTTHSRQRVSPKVTKNFLVVIPPFDVMASFNNKVSSYFKLIDQNLKSITLLSETRDYLIPRLLSGEIDVSKAEKQVEEVL